MREWFELLRVNFYWAWGWVLLAPYAAWLGWRFHLQKGQLLIRVPVLLLAGVAFVWGSESLVRQVATGLGVVVVASKNTSIRTVQIGGISEVVIAPETTVTQIVMRGQSLPPLRLTNSLGLPPELHHLLGSNWLSAQPPADGLGATLPTNLIPRIETSLRAELPRLHGAWGRFPRSAALDVLAYIGLLGLAHAGHLYRGYRERGQQAILLSAQLTQARLRTLQAQLQPHFLFNALNGIATLVRRNPEAAHEMLTSLSELLRLALSQSERQQIPLREEMEFLDRYIEIQQMRFGERLRVEKHLDPDALNCNVPALLLQPLVENAIRHGIEPSANAGWVCLRASRVGEQMVLSIEDDGAGLPLPTVDGLKPGVGLSSVRERLETLYPGQHEFRLQPRPEGGVAVEVRIPIQPSLPLVAVPASVAANQTR